MGIQGRGLGKLGLGMSIQESTHKGLGQEVPDHSRGDPTFMDEILVQELWTFLGMKLGREV